jgi:hypothetical protein
VNTVLAKAPVMESLIIAERLFENIPAVLQNWRVLPHYLTPIISFCESNPQFAAAKNWIPQLIKYIQTTLASKSSIFRQNIDFSSVFMSLANHVELATPRDLQALSAMGDVIIQSQSHVHAYLRLIQVCVTNGTVDISDFLEKVLSNLKDCSSTFLTSFIRQVALTDQIAQRFLNSPRVSKEALVASFLNEHRTQIANEEVKERLIQSPNLLFRLLTLDSPKVLA